MSYPGVPLNEQNGADSPHLVVHGLRDRCSCLVGTSFAQTGLAV